MAYILIDGYNLMGTAHGNLEKARNDLTQRLQEYSKIRGHEITLVFDGWKKGQKDETRIKSGNVTIIYSRLAENADSVIKKILSSSRTPWIVVSSDREISDYAAKKDFAALTSGEFENRLYSTLQNYQYAYESDHEKREEEFLEYDDEEGLAYPAARQRGNPRKLSKRQKKKLQALNKL